MARTIGKGKITTKRIKLEKANSQIFVTIAVASFVISMCFVLLSIIKSEYDFNTRIQSEREEVLELATTNLENIESLETSFKNLENSDDLIPGQGDSANSTIILDALPPAYDFPAIGTSMDDLATRSGVTLKSFFGVDDIKNSVSSDITPVPLEMPFTVIIEGSEEAVTEFTVNLERTIRPMQVLSATYRAEESSIEASYELVTYYQPKVDVDIKEKTIDFSGREVFEDDTLDPSLNPGDQL